MQHQSQLREKQHVAVLHDARILAFPRCPVFVAISRKFLTFVLPFPLLANSVLDFW